MSKGVADYYSHGEFNAICDVCGSKFKASYLRKRWDGLMVCQDDFEQRHPQDFVRGVADIQMTPWSRVEQADVFTNDFCTPNGMTAICDYAVADCCICEYISPIFDPAIGPPPSYHTVWDGGSTTWDRRLTQWDYY